MNRRDGQNLKEVRTPTHFWREGAFRVMRPEQFDKLDNKHLVRVFCFETFLIICISWRWSEFYDVAFH